MNKIIDGKKTSKQIKDELKEEVISLKEKEVYPALAVILVGDNSASEIYVNNKKKACEYVGIKSLSYELPKDTKEEELISLIEKLNNDTSVHGILVQLPLPKHINEKNVINSIKVSKDVDGFHPQNVGSLSIGDECLVSCTPYGIIELLKRYNVEIEGSNCVVVGRSNIVGKPIAQLLLKNNATVTITHSKTKNIGEVTARADILVVAIGRANFIKEDMIKEGAVLIDVGINRSQDNKIYGYIDFESCYEKASLITPVPGGVGPMTIAMLIKNTVEASKKGMNLWLV